MSFISGASLAGSRAPVTTAAQPNITSLGTLTALTVDDIAIDGKVVTMTGSSSDTAVFTVATNGTLSIVTTDDAAAAANITITADGTFEVDGTTITLDSSGDIDLNADGGDVFLKDASTTYGSLTNTSGNLIIKSGTTTAATFSGANVTLAGTVGSGAITSTGVVTATGFTIGSAVINEAELETIDGITAGTVAVSKAVVVDSNKDIGTFRNVTIDGTFSDGNYTFDTSGNVSGLGTVGSGAITSTGVIIGTTVEPNADTSANDNAAIGYTSAEGLILTGQGSTSDVTLKNDADGTVFTVPTGTDDILFADSAKGMWGTGSDLTLYHDGSNSYITNAVGALKLATETSGIALTIGHTTSETTVADNLTVTGNATISGGATLTEGTLTDQATVTWDAAASPVAKVTLGANRTLASATSGGTGQFISLLIIQDGTGSRTLTWNAAYEFKDDTAPTLTTTAAKGDLFVFRYNGAKWLEVGRNTALTLS